MKYLLIISLLFIGCRQKHFQSTRISKIETLSGDTSIYTVLEYWKWNKLYCCSFSFSDRSGKFQVGDSLDNETLKAQGLWPKEKKDTTGLSPYILSVKYINCSLCENHDIEEQFPEDAAKIFYEKGWRNIKDRILCPDHVRDLERGKLKL